MTPVWLLLALLAGAAPPVPHFSTGIIPVLTKAGCNSGACHGAAAGRGGFHLSLFGADPDADHEQLVHALQGRRINLAHPAASLILKKSTALIDHGGDMALTPDGPGAALIESWIAAGAPRGVNRLLTRFRVVAAPTVLAKPGATTTLQAIASLDGEPERDVTAWTVFTTTDPASVTIGPTTAQGAQATVNRRGRHAVIARFLNRVESLPLILPLDGPPPDFRNEPAENWIDRELNASLTELRLPVSPQADDATFIRRATLALTGTLPNPADVDLYTGDRSSGKRAALVDRLLRGADFPEYWTLKLSRVLDLRSPSGEKAGTAALVGWLRDSLRADTPMPMDRWARELLTASGDSHQVGPANFPRLSGDARGQAELVGRVFLGVRLQCANCHNHPLDAWTQDDYHGLAAIFARLERSRVVRIASRGEVTNPRTGQPAIPRLPGSRAVTEPGDPRLVLAEWLTQPNNPHFARAQVNRLWRALFGRGLVEPVDDMRASNPATHPALLDRLAHDFTKNGHDLRFMLRQIALSQAFGRSSLPRPEVPKNDSFYSFYPTHDPEPEVLADAISWVTGVPDPYPGQPLGTRAISLCDPGSTAPSLDILGRCQRQAGCDMAGGGGGIGLPARLHLLNGGLLNDRIGTPAGRLGKLLAADKSDREIIAEFYRVALSRNPTPPEAAGWLARLSQGPLGDRQERLEDFIWALLNCHEFTSNH